MIDHAAYYENIVKGEIAVTCQKLGLDKNDAGFAVSGGGDIGPMMLNNQVGIGPHWSLLISFRSLLLGKPRVGGSLPVAGVLPSDDEFRMTARRLVAEVSQMREKEFRGEMN